MSRRIWAALLGALVLSFSLFAAPTTARADGESNEVGACLASDQVWLLVVTDTDEVLANQCVGAPANGTEALTEAGLELVRDSSNFICTIGGHPEACPAAFNGQFWGSYSGAPGQEYAFAMVGPDENVPAPGTIEAWCYNAPGTTECTPPYLTIIQDGQEIAAPEGVTTQDLPVTGGSVVASEEPSAEATPSVSASPVTETASPSAEATSSTSTPAAEQPAEDTTSQSGGLPWGWILGGAAVVAVGVGIVVWRNGQNKGDGAVGGR
ncbi:MAG TPA: hypothetical protein PKE40_14245 [Arachnia sp.]|nr:hypothetical protein [Arachnia sp.]HMT87504.1 hypothetical protein [Arachnia sp.]